MTPEELETPYDHLRAPQGAEWYSCGRYYKRGVHLRYFVWVNGEWRATTANPRELVGKCERVL